MSRSSWTPLALLAALLAGCDDPVPTQAPPPNPLDPAARPRVVATYPPDGGVGPFDLYVRSSTARPHFILHFDKLIDMPRCDYRWLRVEGFDTPTRLRLYGYTSPFTSFLAMTVHDSVTLGIMTYRIGGTYAVTVDTTLRDATGNSPAAPYRFAFVPEPHFRVVDVDFERGQPVWSTARVLLAWNGEPAGTIGSAIRFEPPVEGQWGGSEDALIFVHERPFAFGTTYALHVDEQAADTQGNRLAAPFTTTFQVRGFEVADTQPRDGWTWVWPNDRYIGVTVTGPLDTTSVRGAFAIQPATQGRFIWETTHFAFVADSDLVPTTQYRVEIGPTLRAWDGTPLAAPRSFSFTTLPFRVVDTTPYAGSIDVPRTTTIEVRFDMELDPSTVEPAFTIVPPVSGAVSVPYATVLEFRPAAPLAPATQYEVTITNALRAANGAVFLDPYTFFFTTTTF